MRKVQQFNRSHKCTARFLCISLFLVPVRSSLSRRLRRQVPDLAIIGISSLATGVADLTADKSLLEMLVEVVLHAPKASLHEHNR